MMKPTIKKTLGWLVVAAALTIGMSACSSDADSIAEPTIQEPAPTSLHITVGAGIANDNATTRAEVVNGTNSDNKPTHTLKFTTGDRLYFWRYIDGNNLTGILTMDGSPSADGLSATFSGDVKLYNGYGEEITNYDYSSINNPLSGSTAYLIPSGAASGCFNEANHLGAIFNESYSIAADVNTLMKTALYVKGDYNSTQQRFNLTKQFPILNCVLGGLTPNTAYSVELRWASEQTNYEYNIFVSKIIYPSTTVTTDGVGNVHFAISGNNPNLTDNCYWGVQLIRGTRTKDYVIGQKTFEPKIYNLTRGIRAYTPSAFSNNQAGTEQYIYNTIGLSEAIWNMQTDYGLTKFKITFTGKDGMGIGGMPFSQFYLKDTNDRTYIINNDEMANPLGFDSATQFYVATGPTMGYAGAEGPNTDNTYMAAAVITCNIGTKTYVGTIPDYISTGGVVSNFGIIELREQ